MAALNPEHVREVVNAINKGPYISHLAMTLKELGIGYSLVELVMGPKHMNPFGGVHGGVYASAIDTAAYWAAYCELEEGVGLISIDLKIDYLAPVKDGVITIRGKSIKIGKSMCLAEATALDKDSKWLAHGTSKMMVTRGLQTIDDAQKFTGGRPPSPKFINSL
jgi:uncharacterized protein (TIGR00369 family)